MADQLERLKAALSDRYRVERELGSGGMATVYLAEDLKHHRKVAVKVLRPELAAALGVERFHREIEIAANLTHPHILPVHDSGDADGFLYYVMPHIEGESLRDKLAKEGELPIGEAVRILRDVVDALSEAHDKGVVHRDIKPDNILLTKHHALVTDFGVAKAVSEATSALKLTTEGVALGTPAYMSPEQAAADQHIDHRADIYAVGVVAYELLTGRTPFLGTTPQMILSAHMTDTPDRVTKYREAVPPALEQLVMKCLEKKAADRWQSAEELLPQLEALATPSGGVTPTGTMPVDRVVKRQWMIGGMAAAVAAVLGLAAALVFGMLSSGPISITTSNSTQVTHGAGLEFQPAISPNGEEVAYVVGPIGNSRIVVRSTIDVGSGGESRPAAEEGGRHLLPAWTPDGASLRIFIREAEPGWSWHEVGKLGGSVRTVSRPWPGTEESPGTMALSPDGTRVVANRGDSIFTYSADSGEPELIGVHVVESWFPHSFAWSPDGQLIAYVTGGRNWLNTFLLGGASSIWIIDAGGGEPVRVTGDEFFDMSPAWLDDGHLLFVSNRDGPRELYVVEVGPRGTRGEPRKVAGVTDPHTISYSIAGRKLAFSKTTARQNIWSYPVDSGTVSISDGHRVTNDNAVIEAHDISPDGRWIVYASNLRGSLDIYSRTLEGGNPTQITDSPSDDKDPRWSPDGTEIAFYEIAGAGRPVMVVSATGGAPVQVAIDPGAGWLPLWSPSGLELAFSSSQSGQYEAWVASREAVGGPWSEARQVTDFGCQPSDWAPDGSGVLCWAGGQIVLVSREGEELWRYDPPTVGLAIPSIHQVFSRDGSTIYAAGGHEDGTEGVWAIPVQGGEPSLVIAYDDPEIDPKRWLVVGPDDRLYLTVGQTEVDIWVADVEVER